MTEVCRPAARRSLAVAATLAMLLVLLPARGAPAVAGEEGPVASPSADKQERILEIIEDFIPYAEAFWRESDLAEADTDYYEAHGPGVTQPRGAGNLAVAYATLLEARPDREQLGGLDRDTLVDRVRNLIRHSALTHRDSGAGYHRWGGDTWQASLEAYNWGFAAHLLWDELDGDTRDLVERVITAEADHVAAKPPQSGLEGNTEAETNGWNTNVPALAAVMFPDDERRGVWDETVARLAINAHSRAADHDDGTLVDERPLSDWVDTVNVHPDLTLENHGFFHPTYQMVAHNNIGHSATLYAHAGRDVPEALSFRTEEIWDTILGPLTSDDGDLIGVQGQDWTSKDYQHLNYFAMLATRFQRPEAAVYESRALELVRRRQEATSPTGAIIGQDQLGYETMLVKRLAWAWRAHELFGPAPTPDQEEFEHARDAHAGVHRSEHTRFVHGRFDDAFTSISFHGSRPMATIVPRGEDHLDDPVFTYYEPGSLLGSGSGSGGDWACDCHDDRFSAAGYVDGDGVSLTTWPDGTSVLIDHGQGETFNVHLERVPGVTGPRPVHSADGEGLGELAGDWVNVADRLGMVVRGGAGIEARDEGGDTGQRILVGSAGTGSGDRIAALFPLADHGTTAALADHVGRVDAPAGWSATYLRGEDGTGRLAAARFGGERAAALALSDERGGPVLPEPGVVDGDTTSVDLDLDAPSSVGHTARYFVAADGPVEAVATGDRARIENPGTDPVAVTIRHVEDGGTRTVERVLAPRERVEARLLDGVLSAAPAALEHVQDARGRIGALRDQLDDWRAAGTLDPAAHARLDGPAAELAASLDAAVDEATSADPDTAAMSAALRDAGRHLDRLAQRGEADTTGDVRADLRRSVERIRDSLDAALAVGLGVALRIEPSDVARPGEALDVVVTVTNPGQGDATHLGLETSLPEGWEVTDAPSLPSSLPGGAAHETTMTLRAPDGAEPGTDVELAATLEYRQRGERRTVGAADAVAVGPLFDVRVVEDVVPLALGGWNVAGVVVDSHASRDLTLTTATDVPEGVSRLAGPEVIDVPAGAEASAAFELTQDAHTDGSDEMTVTVGDGPSATSVPVELAYGDDLARNGAGARWPRAFADHHQPAFPPGNFNDGSDDTFWVSEGTEPGEGPTPDNPIALGIDFGGQVTFDEVTMVPRPIFGPRSYTIEVSDDGEDWDRVAEVADGPDATIRTAFEAVTARMVRLLVTDGHDRPQYEEPRNTQVRQLQVREAPENLAMAQTGEEFPVAFADQHQPAYPPEHVNDGDHGTFWVSEGTEPGEGPTPDNPIAVGVELGDPRTVGRVVVVPRQVFGPRSYTIEVSDDGDDWDAVAAVEDGPDETVTTTFAPTEAEAVRLVLTDAYDRPQYPLPRSVQIREIELYAR